MNPWTAAKSERVEATLRELESVSLERCYVRGSLKRSTKELYPFKSGLNGRVALR